MDSCACGERGTFPSPLSPSRCDQGGSTPVWCARYGLTASIVAEIR
jgi:hypothetical protein